MQDQMKELKRRQKIARGMGGPERVARQHTQGRMTARERIEFLLDPRTFLEVGQLAWASESHRQAPADGVITGYGKLQGRVVSIAAEDFTVLGGSWGHAGKRKTGLTSDMALSKGVPYIWLADGSGGRVQEEMGSHILGEGSRVFDVMVKMTGVIPRAAGIMGPAFGISGFMAALADFTVMVKGSAWGMSGPPVVRAAIGEDITAEELGGVDVHAQMTGQADRIAGDDQECLGLIRDFLSFMPPNASHLPPRFECSDPYDRAEPSLLHIIPENHNQPYDMREVITRLVDDGVFFPFKPSWGLNLIVGLGRLGGRTVGLMANQPRYLGGALDAKASDKGARFTRLCGRFNIPMIYLIDTPGFLVGSDVEQESSLSRAMAFLQALHDAQVPKIAVFVRKGYGLGFHVMAGISPDIKIAWPSAQVGIMGPEAGVEVIHRKRLDESPDPETLRSQLLQEWRSELQPWGAAAKAFITDVIDPRETRGFLNNALDIIQSHYHPKHPSVMEEPR